MDIQAPRMIVVQYEQVGGQWTFTARFAEDLNSRSVGKTPWQAVENLYLGIAALESFLRQDD